ncbi:hypothetical protein TH19_04620 [Thalassospira profundimaris]|uniref:Uncharacterized protein n=1 Tax=Thalassospira profundimaris TaxID=502049 RepID=A0A367WCA0_9PROT|nr:hypothetical protein TH19_04620 [Thalassospira profundimaris]
MAIQINKGHNNINLYAANEAEDRFFAKWLVGLTSGRPRMFLRLLISVAMLTAVFRAVPASAQSSDYEKAIAGILSSPQAAFSRIATRTDGLGVLDQILIRFAIETVSPERDALILDMQTALNAVISEKVDPDLSKRVGPLRAYDGTLESLIPTVVMASASGVSVSHPSFYAIPCAVLRVEPGMLKALAPVYGDQRDGTLPRAGCIWGRGAIKNYPLDEVSAFIDASFSVAVDTATSGEAIPIERILAKTHALQRAMVAPETLPRAPVTDVLPYDGWAAVMPERRSEFEQLIVLGRTAQSGLIQYWTKNGTDPQAAQSNAERTLFATTLGADCGGAIPVTMIRAMIFQKQPASAFASLPNAMDVSDAKSKALCGGDKDKGVLLHLAVGRPDILAMLYVRGYITDMESPDGQGKTALMAAAEKNNLSAVNWLLANGANINARTRQTGPGEEPKHGYRTALHYAAASASLAVMTSLMAAGADPFNADDEGYRAVDYLTGWAQVGGNRTLSAQDFAQARRMLGG